MWLLFVFWEVLASGCVCRRANFTDWLLGKHVKTLAGHSVMTWTSSEAGNWVLVRERLAATCDGA